MRYINHPYWGRLENRTDWYSLEKLELAARGISAFKRQVRSQAPAKGD